MDANKQIKELKSFLEKEKLINIPAKNQYWYLNNNEIDQNSFLNQYIDIRIHRFLNTIHII